MGNVRKLTTKQHKFAVLLVTKGDRMSAKECAIEAGFSEKSAQQAAANLTNPKMFPLVVSEIERLRREWEQKYKVTYGRHIRRLDDLSRGAEEAGNWAAAVAAEKSRGQAAGLYIDRKEILTGSIDQLSKAEVEEKLKEIEKQFSINTDVIDITPED
jgi:LPS O-antigen subunit length determinant protein (WzzB/FepE family)|tara:strand:+ start:2476 stop:2946 length:471 start_codon:yes stop_codon:yes gene_type:complete